METSISTYIRDHANMFENSTDYIYIKNADSKPSYIYLNQNLRMLINTGNLDELIGKTDEDMPWSEFTDSYREHDRDTILGLQYYQLEHIRDGNNELSIIMTRKFGLYDESGSITGIIGFTNKINNISMDHINLTGDLVYYDKKPLKISNYLQNQLIEHQHRILTSRESECLFYLLRGKTSKEIAKKLTVSPKTVDFHIENIKNKWDCHSRSDLFDKAYEYQCFNVIPPEIFATLNVIGA